MTQEDIDNRTTIEPGSAWEYASLRDEIIKRIELRQQIIAITLTFAGILIGVGIENPSAALIYPPLAAFLAIGWLQNDLRVKGLATYVRERLEPAVPGLGWETFVHEGRMKTRGRLWRYVILSHTGIFFFTQILALGIGVLNFAWTSVEQVLIGVDIVALLVVIIIAFLARR